MSKYLCSICEQPRIPARVDDVYICGRCDLIVLDGSPPKVDKPAKDEQ